MAEQNEAPRGKAAKYLRNSSKPPTLLRQGYAGFSSPSSPQRSAEYSAKENKITQRLRIIEGQVRGLREMIERGKYCIDVIAQSSAVKQGLSNIEDILMEKHLGSCVLRQMKSGETKKAVDEILKVYKLKRR